MKKTLKYFLFISLISSMIGCSDELSNGTDDKLSSLDNEKVAIFMASYNSENNSYTLKNKVVSFDEIVGYDPKTHIFLINTIASNRLSFSNPENYYPVTGAPFVLLVNGEIIYGGLFVPSLSSCIIQDKICIDPIIDENKLKVNLGYPGTFSFTGVDSRNDSRLITTLEYYHKIITVIE